MTLPQLTSIIFDFCKTHEATITAVLSASVAALVIYIGYKERQESKEPVRPVKDHNKMHYPTLKDWQDVNRN